MIFQYLLLWYKWYTPPSFLLLKVSEEKILWETLAIYAMSFQSLANWTSNQLPTNQPPITKHQYEDNRAHLGLLFTIVMGLGGWLALKAPAFREHGKHWAASVAGSMSGFRCQRGVFPRVEGESASIISGLARWREKRKINHHQSDQSKVSFASLDWQTYQAARSIDLSGRQAVIWKYAQEQLAAPSPSQPSKGVRCNPGTIDASASLYNCNRTII